MIRMCGIVGRIYFKKNALDKKSELPLIKNSLERLHHRGPDDSGYIIDSQVWLGATRLSIIDLSPAGRQPFQNEN